MKKTKRIKLKGILASATAVMVFAPVVAISTVACSSGSESRAQIQSLVINTQPKSQDVIIGQTQNLPTFSVGVSASDQNTYITYQWYKNSVNSTINAVAIPNAKNCSYQVTPNDIKVSGTTYFYAVINGYENGVNFKPIISNISELNVSFFAKNHYY